MTKAYRAEARERLKNCVGARLSAEALVIALVGGRIDQSDWSIECDRVISLLDDDTDYRRGFKDGYEDGLHANTRAAFAAAKQAMTERTCKMEQSFTEPSTLDHMQEYLCSECGEYAFLQVLDEKDRMSYCPNCGAKVVDMIETEIKHGRYNR